jgi:8-amino-7-oxononanoate synthase
LRYAHADANAVAERLRTLAEGDVLVVTDGVFSMDGDIAPLTELAAACTQRGVPLICDDAHGFGVLGPQGAGVLDQCGLGPDAVSLLIGTFGKALGAFGAFVAGNEPLVEALIQFARPYIYTTALPPAIAVAVRESLRIVRSEAALRARLHHCITYFRIRAGARGLPLAPSTTPIQPLILGSSQRTMDIAARLRTHGFLVGAIRPPSVPAGSSRLRITLSAAHREEQIDALVERLASLV